MIKRFQMFFKNQKEKYHQCKKKTVLEWFIYLLLFCFLFSMPSFSYNSFHNIPVVLMMLLSLLILFYQLIYYDIYVDKIVLSLILFVLWTIINCLINGFDNYRSSYIVLPIMFFALYFFFSNSKEHLENTLSVLKWSFIIFSLYFLLIYYKDILSLNFTRLGEYFGDLNVIGSYFSLGSAVCLYHVFKDRKFLNTIPLFVFLILGFLTGSKAFLLSIGALVIYYVISFFGKRKWYVSLLIICSMFVLVVILLQLDMFSNFKTRIVDMLNLLIGKNVSHDMSTYTRLFFIIEGLFLFFRYFLFGLGTYGFAENSFYAHYSHNNIVELLSNFGIIAFILFEYSLFFSVVNNKIKDKDSKRIFYAMVILIVIGMFVVVQITDKFYYLQLALVCSMSRISNETEKLISVKFGEKGDANE